MIGASERELLLVVNVAGNNYLLLRKQTVMVREGCEDDCHCGEKDLAKIGLFEEKY